MENLQSIEHISMREIANIFQEDLSNNAKNQGHIDSTSLSHFQHFQVSIKSTCDLQMWKVARNGNTNNCKVISRLWNGLRLDLTAFSRSQIYLHLNFSSLSLWREFSTFAWLPPSSANVSSSCRNTWNSFNAPPSRLVHNSLILTSDFQVIFYSATLSCTAAIQFLGNMFVACWNFLMNFSAAPHSIWNSRMVLAVDNRDELEIFRTFNSILWQNVDQREGKVWADKCENFERVF